MSKGFLVVAENNNNIDFIEMAYLLALSLHQSQSKYKSLSIITTETDIDEKYKKVFDKIIVKDKQDNWSEFSKSIDTTHLCASYYDETPYDETIVLDADFLFTVDIDNWWTILGKHDLVFTQRVKTFRDEDIDEHDNFYRRLFKENNLPNIYTGMFYFKKSDKSELFFNTVKYVFENWKEFYKDLEGPKTDFLSADVAYAIAYRILDLPDMTYLSVPTFVHMKTRLQNISNISEEWSEDMIVSLKDYDLKINNYSQKYPFHYHDKKFVTRSLLENFEQVLR